MSNLPETEEDDTITSRPADAIAAYSATSTTGATSPLDNPLMIADIELNAAPKSSPATTISSFPLEILARMLEVGMESEGIVSDGSHRDFLNSSSLVNRAWRVEAQRLLWSNVHLEEQSNALLLLDSEALGRWPTHKLQIWGPREEDDDEDRDGVRAITACQIVDKLRGIEDLVLSNFSYLASLGMEIFSYPSLQNLQSLTHERVFLFPNGFTHSPVIPFSLNQLALWNGTNLLAHSPQPAYDNLTRLTLNFSWDLEEDSNFLAFFSSVSPQLRSLTISNYSIPFLFELYRHCSSLTELELSGDSSDLIKVLTSIPNSLEVLTLHLDDVPSFIAGINGVLSTLSLSKLKVLKIRDGSGIFAPRANLGSVDGGSALREHFESRGVRFV